MGLQWFLHGFQGRLPDAGLLFLGKSGKPGKDVPGFFLIPSKGFPFLLLLQLGRFPLGGADGFHLLEGRLVFGPSLPQVLFQGPIEVSPVIPGGLLRRIADVPGGILDRKSVV